MPVVQADNAPIPRRTLALLLMAVLAAHGAVLIRVDLEPPRVHSAPAAAPQPLATRLLPPPAPPPAPVPLTVAEPAPPAAPAPRRAHPAAKTRPNKAPAPIEYAPPATLFIAGTAESGEVEAPSPSRTELVAAADLPEPVAAPAPPTLPTPPTTTAEPAPATPPAPAAPIAPVAIPRSAQLEYDVEARTKGVANRASATLRWQHDGANYDAELRIDSFTLRLVGRTRVQTSRGRIAPQGLMPQRFSDRARSEQAAHFSDDGRLATFSANTPAAPLDAGAQDRLSVVLQLAALLAGDPARYPAGSRIAVQTVGAREAERWVFSVEGGESLDLPAGTIDAIRLLRAPRREYDTTVEFWLAPALGWLPVRTRLTYANGDQLDQLLRTLP